LAEPYERIAYRNYLHLRLADRYRIRAAGHALLQVTPATATTFLPQIFQWIEELSELDRRYKTAQVQAALRP
jgi:hypothetical protein